MTSSAELKVEATSEEIEDGKAVVAGLPSTRRRFRRIMIGIAVSGMVFGGVLAALFRRRPKGPKVPSQRVSPTTEVSPSLEARPPE